MMGVRPVDHGTYRYLPYDAVYRGVESPSRIKDPYIGAGANPATGCAGAGKMERLPKVDYPFFVPGNM